MLRQWIQSPGRNETGVFFVKDQAENEFQLVLLMLVPTLLNFFNALKEDIST